MKMAVINPRENFFFVITTSFELDDKIRKILRRQILSSKSTATNSCCADLLSVPINHQRDFDRVAHEHHLCCGAFFLYRNIGEADGVERARKSLRLTESSESC
jgi:hypothetical protein